MKIFKALLIATILSACVASPDSVESAIDVTMIAALPAAHANNAVRVAVIGEDYGGRRFGASIL